MDKYSCECGSIINHTKYSIKRHKKTKKHQSYLSTIVEPMEPVEEKFIPILLTTNQIENISRRTPFLENIEIYIEIRNYFNQYDFTIPNYDKDLTYEDNCKNIGCYMNSIIDKLRIIESYLIDCFPALRIGWNFMDVFSQFCMDRIVDKISTNHRSFMSLYSNRKNMYIFFQIKDDLFIVNHRRTISKDMIEHYERSFQLRTFINDKQKMNQPVSVKQFHYTINMWYNLSLNRIDCCGKEYFGKNVKKHLHSKKHKNNLLCKLKTNQYTKEDPILLIGAIPFYREKNYYVFRGQRCIQRFATLWDAYEAGIDELSEYFEYLETSIYCLNEKMEPHRYAEPALIKSIMRYMK